MYPTERRANAATPRANPLLAIVQTNAARKAPNTFR
jgi:hypothetical protein